VPLFVFDGRKTMSLIPAFEIGVWNAWIFMLLIFAPFLLGLLINKEAMNKLNEGWASENWSKAHRRLALATHIVIIPFTIIYSIFLPIILGTAWLYTGLAIFLLALIISIVASINIATTGLNSEPITKGVYRISRHPIYFSGFLMFLGIGIACASWVFILFALAWIVMWHIAVRSEEGFLLQKYGDSYRDYMNRTPRWIGIPKS